MDGNHTVQWEDGRRFRHCQRCIDLYKDAVMIRPGDTVSVNDCKLCGGATRNWFSGKVVERVNDEKGSRYRVRILDDTRKKGRFFWRCCPLCVQKSSGLVIDGVDVVTTPLDDLDIDTVYANIKTRPVNFKLNPPRPLRLRMDL